MNLYFYTDRERTKYGINELNAIIFYEFFQVFARNPLVIRGKVCIEATYFNATDEPIVMVC